MATTALQADHASTHNALRATVAHLEAALEACQAEANYHFARADGAGTEIALLKASTSWRATPRCDSFCTAPEWP